MNNKVTESDGSGLLKVGIHLQNFLVICLIH
jgi:hypothetical protein